MLEIALTNPQLAVAKLGLKRVKLLRAHIERRGVKQATITDRDVLENTLFSDKLRIIKSCAKTIANVPALQNKQLDDVDNVRNSLAHASTDFRLIRILSKERFHVFLVWLTEFEAELRNYYNVHSPLED
jgi:hypothetical protein